MEATEHGGSEGRPEVDDWTLVDCDCSSERSFSGTPAVDPGNSPRSDVAADLVLAQPLPTDVPPPPTPPALPGLGGPRLPGRARDAGVHVPDLLADLTPGAVVAAAASVWMGFARAWLRSACDAVIVVRDTAMVVARAAAKDGADLSHVLVRAACSAGGTLEVALGATRAAGVAARHKAARGALQLHASVAQAYKQRTPPAWALLSMGIATTVSIAAVGTLAVANRSLAGQLRQRDRELAHLVLSIVNLQEALQSSRAGAPLLRHVSLSPSSLTVSSMA